ncbi:MAG TPA: ATP-binding protein [Planctomycetota bacterium]|nr:ATP-binding protein [Planctomycetota bacterium]
MYCAVRVSRFSLPDSSTRVYLYTLSRLPDSSSDQNHNTETALHESRTRLKLALEAAGMDAWDWDITQDRVSCTFLPEGHTVSLSEFMEWIHPDDRSLISNALRTTLEEHGSYVVQFRMSAVSGVLRWYHSRGHVFRNQNGVPVRMIGVCMDVSDRISADERAARLFEQTQRASRMKDQFFAMLAHELRNPLMPMRNALEILCSPECIPAQRGRAEQMIKRQIGQMARLVGDLLDIARIERGKLELRLQHVELKQVLRDAMETCGHMMRSHRHLLEMESSSEPIYVKGDAVRLEQIFCNVLDNAAKYTPNGGRISIFVEPQGPYAVIRVRDNGIGMQPEMLERVFDLYVQAEDAAAQSAGGLGIGLRLVRHLATMHGGSVQARSDGPGKGSEFVISLPLVSDLPPPEPESTSDDNASLSTRCLRIVLIDDDADSIDSLQELFTIWGHEVFTAQNGRDGIDLVLRHRPHVAFVDIGLVGIDGHEVARRLRAALKNSMLLVAISGFGQPEDLARSKSSGFDRHLVKPPDIRDLRKVLLEVPLPQL